jgi:hypothetical protein
MPKMTTIALVFFASMFFASMVWNGGARAQNAGFDAAPPPPERLAPGGAPGLANENNLTATGETAPHPGASQSAGPTQLDRNILKKDDEVQRGICSNC